MSQRHSLWMLLGGGVALSCLLGVVTACCYTVEPPFREQCERGVPPVVEGGALQHYYVSMAFLVVSSRDATLVGQILDESSWLPSGSETRGITFSILTDIESNGGFRVVVDEFSILFRLLHSTCSIYRPVEEGLLSLPADGTETRFFCSWGFSDQDELALRVEELDESGEAARIAASIRTADGTEHYLLQSTSISKTGCIEPE